LQQCSGYRENNQADVRSRGLNSAVSNAAWPTKRAELAKRSQLLVNQRLCAHETWHEAGIDARGSELCGHVLATWPGPDAEVWGAPLPATEPEVTQ
jgi:hypothetical protein